MEALTEFRAEDLVAEFLRRTGKKEVMPASDIEVHCTAFWERREIYFAPGTYKRAFYRVADVFKDRCAVERAQIIRGQRKAWGNRFTFFKQFTEDDVAEIRAAVFDKKKARPGHDAKEPQPEL